MLLCALNSALQGERLSLTDKYSDEEWQAFFEFATNQNVLSLVWEALSRSESLQSISKGLYKKYQKRAFQIIASQMIQTDEFLALYKSFSKHSLKPIVVKGIICRQTYPVPDYRVSGDEDIFVSKADFDATVAVITENNMEKIPFEIADDCETAYCKQDGQLCIEVHTGLFETPDGSLDGFDDFFDGCFDNTVTCKIKNVDITTMNPTDHMLFLICHAFKHFISRGLGIRQVCDIIMLAKYYKGEIDWQYIYKKCGEKRIEVFTAALLQIGERHLSFDSDSAQIPDIWRNIDVDCNALLDDLLSYGVFGEGSSNGWSRATIASNAVATVNTKNNFILKSIFPSYRFMAMRNAYLKKYPFMLPIAWCGRILKYLGDVRNESNSLSDVTATGKEQLKLLRQYKIID